MRTTTLLFLGLLACSGGASDVEPGATGGEGSGGEGSGDEGSGDEGSGESGGGESGDDGGVADDCDELGLNGDCAEEPLPAPDFAATNYDGAARDREDVLGHPTVMWFYPAAGTAG